MGRQAKQRQERRASRHAAVELPAPAPPLPRRRPWRLAVVVGGALVIGALAWGLATRGGASPRPDRLRPPERAVAVAVDEKEPNDSPARPPCRT